MNKYIKLSNRIEMPIIGFGTYNTGDFLETVESVKTALASGYKQIDTESRGKIFNNPLMIELSNKYKKDIGQIILRWHIQNNIIPIPKSSNKERILSNLDIFNFEISK